MTERRLGRKPLPRDDRDYPLRDLLPAKAAGATFRYWYSRLRLDQGDTGTCEGNGWTHYLADGPVTHPAIAELKDPAAAEEFARTLYVEATGDETLQDGAYSRQVLRVLRDRGLVASYHRAASVEEIVQAVLTLGPVGFGSEWYRSLDDPVEDYGNAYCYVDEASGSRGGHFYIFDGVNLNPADGPPFLEQLNSWGPSWAHNGRARFPIEDVHKLFVGDAWICTEVAG